MQKSFALFLALAMVLSLVGCVSNEATSIPNHSDASEPTTADTALPLLPFSLAFGDSYEIAHTKRPEILQPLPAESNAGYVSSEYVQSELITDFYGITDIGYLNPMLGYSFNQDLQLYEFYIITSLESEADGETIFQKFTDYYTVCLGAESYITESDNSLEAVFSTTDISVSLLLEITPEDSVTFYAVLHSIPYELQTPGDTEEDTDPQNGSSTPNSAVPYLFDVTRADQPIYNGPGYGYTPVGTVGKAGIYTIVEESLDADGNLWGKLKSGVGWIDLTAAADPAEPQFEPYILEINQANLPIYNGPGYGYSIVGTVGIPGLYTIVEESRDSDGNLWGRLKSGAGWINLTDATSPPSLTADYADEALLASGTYYEYTVGASEYTVYIAFRSNSTLYDVYLSPMEFLGDTIQIGFPLFMLDTLTPDKPLVAGLVFPGDLSSYCIYFTDSAQVTHYYLVSMSGLDGSVVLSEYTP